ncbi:DMT family transporter [Pelagibacterium limicola]|uniref:DMT family transporter n=1 Tax=Pelagibacterium limicola TaxID=2791022 RepID=UPI0018AF9BF2|nr:DMT family transporter [Pelagibacterium limicola]
MNTAPFAAQTNVGKGVAFLLIATAVFGIQDVLTKILVQDYSAFQIVMIRYWAFALFSFWLVMRQGPIRRAFASSAPFWQIARGILLVLDIWLFTEALKTVPLGDLGAIIMTYPLLVTLFAIPFLGERVGPFRAGAVLAGFAGAMIILRPGFAAVEIGVIYGLLSAATFALYLVFTRKVAAVDSTTTSIFYVGAVGLAMTTAVGLFHWQPMRIEDILAVSGLCVTMCIAHGLVMVSMRYAPASVLQPFNYFSLPWAITLGFVVFGTIIEGFALLGAIVIVCAGLAVMWREQQLARRARLSAAASAQPSTSPPQPGSTPPPAARP